jgi:hypothetical protein
VEPSVIAAIASAVAAAASATAAWKSLTLSRETARRTAENERRLLARDADEIARVIVTEAKRAAEAFDSLKTERTALAVLQGAYNSGHRQLLDAKTDAAIARLAKLRANGEHAVGSARESDHSALSDHLPRLRANLAEVRAMLADAQSDIEAVRRGRLACLSERAAAQSGGKA